MKVENTNSGIVHASAGGIDDHMTYCGCPEYQNLEQVVKKRNSNWIQRDDDTVVTCKNCLRSMGVGKQPPAAKEEKIENTNFGIVHGVNSHGYTHCSAGIMGSANALVKDHNNWRWAPEDSKVTCKNCLQVLRGSDSSFKCNVTEDRPPPFSPFTLNMRLTTKESARNLYKLLEWASDEEDEINEEQRRMAENICNTLSATVANIKG